MSLNPEAIRYDQDKIVRELIHASVARKVAFHNPELNYLTDSKFRYEQEGLNTNPQVDKGFGTTRRADFELKYVDVEVTNIRESIGYSRDQVAKIENSLLPIGDRARAVVRKMAASEDRYFFAGDPKFANSGMADSNNHVVWGGTAFNVTSFELARNTLGAAVGQLIDHYDENIQALPLFLVVTPNVYKLMLTKANQYTSVSLIDVLTQELKTHGANTPLPTHVYMSKFLGAALDYDGIDVVVETIGSSNAALIAYDPNYTEVVCSPLDQHSYMVGSDLEIELGESYVPTWKNVNSIIYEAGVTV